MITKEGIELFKIKRLEKKYKDIINSEDIINKVSKLDSRLKKMKKRLKEFDSNLEEYKKPLNSR